MYIFKLKLKLMRFFFLLIIFFFQINIAFSQVHIKGVVYNKDTKEVLEGVTVFITSTNKEIGTYTNEKGVFKVELEKNKQYLFSFSSVFTHDLKIGITAVKDTLLNIPLTQSISLNEVTIQARKKIIESKIDRLVYNVNNDPLSKTLTTKDLLRRIPLLRIRNDDIQIVGKGTVLISINGRLQQLSSGEVLSYLNNIDPKSIKNIEIITTPPANYSAEGNAGIINIVTKDPKKENEGLSGSIRSSYIQRSFPGNTNALSLNYKKNKLSLSTSFNYSTIKMKSELYSSGNNIEENTNRKDEANRFGAYAAMNYRLSKNHILSASFNLFNGTSKNKYTNLRSADNHLTTNGNRRNEQTKYIADFNYTYKLDSLGKTFSTYLSYNVNKPTEKFIALSSNKNNEYDRINNNGNVKNTAFSSQLDFHFPYSVGTLDYGFQYYSLSNKAEMSYILNEKKEIQYFYYDEKNYSAYISFTPKEIGKFKFKGGLRYEWNNAELESEEEDNNITHRRKGNLFPTFYAMYTTKNKARFLINYSRRINRPKYSTITPFRWYDNKFSYSTGNPFIVPYISDNIEFRFIKGNFSISAYTAFIKDGYGRVDLFEDNLWKYTYENYFDQSKYGINVSYYFTQIKWLKSDLFATFYQNRLKSNVSYIENNKSLAFSYQINNNIYLDADKKYVLSVNYWRDLPFYNRNTYYYSYGSLDIGVNISLLKKRLNLGLLITDVANQSITKMRSEYTGYSIYRREYYDARSIKLSVRYNWGMKKIDPVKRSDKFKERERIN